MWQTLSILFFAFISFSAGAQMPDTDLWLFKFEKDKTGRLFPDKPVNITNRPGYDNQPSFSPDNKRIYYVSVREDKQADIYYYDISSKKNIQLTKSRESEYSPVMNGNGRSINSVVVEADSAQRIHYINAEKGLFEKKFEPDSVGYYTFLNKDTVIYYKLTEPHSLRYYIAATGEDKWLGNSPTRTFRALDRHTLVYGIKDSTKVVFYKYDFLMRKAEKYCEYASLSEDILWHHSMGLLKSEGARLYRYDDKKKEWELLYDLSLFGIKKITRFSFDTNNKYLVVVNNL